MPDTQPDKTTLLVRGAIGFVKTHSAETWRKLLASRAGKETQLLPYVPDVDSAELEAALLSAEWTVIPALLRVDTTGVTSYYRAPIQGYMPTVDLQELPPTTSIFAAALDDRFVGIYASCEPKLSDHVMIEVHVNINPFAAKVTNLWIGPPCMDVIPTLSMNHGEHITAAQALRRDIVVAHPVPPT